VPSYNFLVLGFSRWCILRLVTFSLWSTKMAFFCLSWTNWNRTNKRFKCSRGFKKKKHKVNYFFSRNFNDIWFWTFLEVYGILWKSERLFALEESDTGVVPKENFLKYYFQISLKFYFCQFLRKGTKHIYFIGI